METSYFNTTQTVHPELGRYEKKAKSQEVELLDFFMQRPRFGRYSPSLLKNDLFPGTPLTSVRRALTNLTNAGELVKTDKQVIGPYGRLEHCWKLAPKYDQRELF